MISFAMVNADPPLLIRPVASRFWQPTSDEVPAGTAPTERETV